jgi:hypothetical protein
LFNVSEICPDVRQFYVVNADQVADRRTFVMEVRVYHLSVHVQADRKLELRA